MTRNQTLMRPWWKPVVWWSVMTPGTALLYTFLPEMDRGWTFLGELRYAAILATVVLAAIIGMNAIQDRWDRRKNAAGRG